MTHTILITRPLGDEHHMKSELHDHDYRVIHEPMMEIMLQHQTRHEVTRALLNEPNAIIVTSRHGIRALAALTEFRDSFLICVGESTARVAQSAGFTNITTANGTAEGIIELITTSYDEGSRFVYASGEHISIDIGGELEKAGMLVERIIVYEAIACTQLSDTLIEQLKRDQIDGITFLSQRTAEIFTILAKAHEVEETLSNISAFCMSSDIADGLTEAPWKAIYISEDTTLASLINSIDNVFNSNG